MFNRLGFFCLALSARAMTALSFLVVLLPQSSAQAAFAEAKPAAGLIQIAADHQEYDGSKGQSLFRGNVNVHYKNFQIKGTEAAVDVSASGSPELASFYKRPFAKRTEVNGKMDDLVADVIRIHLADDAISAEGNAVTHITTVATEPFTIRADIQQFDNETKTVVASGQVQVDYKGTRAFSPKATLKMSSGGKAEKVVFTGGARLEKENSLINGERVTVMVESGNLIAENNVKTDVNLKQQGEGSDKVQIFSDYQQYDKASETVLASGNVKIIYGGYVATGPKATFKIQNGQIREMYLTGRSSIIEKDRKVVADKITITTNPRHFDAYGNVKTQFITHSASQAAPASNAKQPKGKPAPKAGGSAAQGKGTPAGANAAAKPSRKLPLTPDEEE